MKVLRRLKEELDSEHTEPVIDIIEGQSNSITRIIEYIWNNYAEDDLNLSKLAQEFGFNSSYLSRKFKNETGISFIEYLTRFRMEQAKKMACRNMPMYAVAINVGIPDSNYFGKCFRKCEGITYSEYIATSESYL